MRHDLLSDALSKIQNAERVGKPFCKVPASKLIRAVLEVMHKNGYVGKIHKVEKGFNVELIGRINSCKAIRPRFSVMVTEYEKFEKRYLPAKGVGILIVSTSLGVLSQNEAIKKHIGGKLLAYVY
jgi:small subunit ribosomal protein S8